VLLANYFFLAFLFIMGLPVFLASAMAAFLPAGEYAKCLLPTLGTAKPPAIVYGYCIIEGMKRLVAMALVAALWVSTASAAPSTPTGTLSLLTPPPYSLGSTVQFSWSADLKKSQNPRIQVVCDQAGVVVYGEAQNAVGHSFKLGGGSSLWLQTGGPAHCVATLYYWDFHPVQVFNPLASVEF
jgi:hypothetical protein